MGKKNKKSSTSGDDPANTKKHKRSSTTDENDEDEIISLRNEIKEMSKSIKELTEAFEKQKEILQTIADQHEGKDEDYCNFECEEAEQKLHKSILVKGLDENMGRRKDIKKVLGGVFGSCGKIKSIFVPIACQTGVSLGYAFITFEDYQGGNEKALKMNGYSLKGRQLEVKKAINSVECYGYSGSASDAVGCKRCLNRPRHYRSMSYF